MLALDRQLSLRLLRFVFGGLVLAWAGGAAGQAFPTPPSSEDSYVPDLSQSDVQELGGRGEASADPAPQPLVAEDAPEEPSLQNCQDYDQAVIADGQPRLAHGTACQDHRGSWQVVSPPALSRERAYPPRITGICREFRQPNVFIEGARSAYFTACRPADGAPFFAVYPASGRGRGTCDVYEQDIRDADRTIAAYGTACEGPDGSWQIVSAPAFGRKAVAEGKLARAPLDNSRAWEEMVPLYRERPLPPREYRPLPPRRFPATRVESSAPETSLAKTTSRITSAVGRVILSIVDPKALQAERDSDRTGREY